tara:strand:- start:137 stop:667 length:531 start_codon:yes stop_codon:yes gene_type:complete
MSKKASHTLETMARLCDLSKRRVQQLVAEGVIPKNDEGRYYLEEAIPAYIKFLKDKSIKPGIISLDKVRARKTLADAEMAEIDLSVRRGELVEVKDVLRDWLEQIGSCKSKLLNIPSKLAPIVAVEDSNSVCQSLIEVQIHEALNELSESDFGSEETMETTTTAVDQSVGRPKQET